MSQNRLLFSVVFCACFLIMCQRNSVSISDQKNAIRDALFQAIALEKIPDISTLIESDTLYVYPCNNTDSSDYQFSKSLAELLPIHVDNWRVKIIDDNFLSPDCGSISIKYLIIALDIKKKELIVDMIINTRLAQAEKELLLIDRGRLTVTFKKDGQIWRVSDIYRWYG